MDVIVVLPNITSETLGAINSMGPGGTNHLDNLLLLHNNNYYYKNLSLEYKQNITQMSNDEQNIASY